GDLLGRQQQRLVGHGHFPLSGGGGGGGGGGCGGRGCGRGSCFTRQPQRGQTLSCGDQQTWVIASSRSPAPARSKRAASRSRSPRRRVTAARSSGRSGSGTSPTSTVRHTSPVRSNTSITRSITPPPSGRAQRGRRP